jgi:hypothetical protein
MNIRHLPLTLNMIASSLILMNSNVHAEQISYLPGMQLGVGYDTVTGKTLQQCINTTSESVPGPTAIILTTYSLSELTSSADLLSRTSVDLSASVDYGLYSASAEMALLSQSHISNYSANMLAQASVERNWRYAKNPTLAPDKAGLASSNPGSFRRTCGNRYVSGVLYGGEFYGLITANTSSQSEHDSISIAINGSYVSFSASGTLSDDTQSLLSKSGAKVTGYISGGSSHQIDLTMDGLRKRMSQFPQEIQRTGGTPIRVILTEYPDQSSETPLELQYLVTNRWDYETILEEVNYVLKNPSQFNMQLVKWGPVLNRLKSEIMTSAAALNKAISDCKQGLSVCEMPNNIRHPDDIRSELPPRYLGTCGELNVAPQGLMLDVQNLIGRCGGDGNIAGHPAKIEITSKIVATKLNQELDANTSVSIREDRSDWTCFQGTSTKMLVQIPVSYPGCYFNNVLPVSSEGSLKTTSGSDVWDWVTYQNGTGFIESASCRVNAPGSDIGKLGCRDIKLRPILVNLDHAELRMSDVEVKNLGPTTWSNRAKTVARVKELGQAEFMRAAVTLRPYIGNTSLKPNPVASRKVSIPSASFDVEDQKAVPSQTR